MAELDHLLHFITRADAHFSSFCCIKMKTRALEMALVLVVNSFLDWVPSVRCSRYSYLLQQVLAFFSNLIKTLGNNIEFVVQPTTHDGMSVGVVWKLGMPSIRSYQLICLQI